MRSFLPLLVIAVLLFSVDLPAQQRNRSEETQQSFRQLRQTFLQPEKGASPQSTEQERSRSVEAWVKKNSWKELPLQEQTWLAEAMTGPDQIDKRSFSVRWTGKLNVPANGNYTFSPFTSAGADGTIKLWLNEQLILDTNPPVVDRTKDAIAGNVKNKNAAAEKKQVVPNGSVSLTAGKPIPFRLEFVRTSAKINQDGNRTPSYPAAVLAWQSEVMERQIVPPGAFLPPQDYLKEGKQGLKGEYFADVKFSKRVAVRLDPNIDFLWDTGRVAAEYRDSQREIAAAAVAKITAPGFLASLKPDEAKDFVQKQLPALFGILTATERVAVFKAVGENTSLLQYLTYPQLAGAVRWYAAQPDANLAIDLLVKWSKTSSAPQTQPGFIPGRTSGGYLNQNIEPYFRLARLFLGDDVDKKITVLSENAVNEDGTCNLTMTYVLCCVCRLSGKPKVIADLTDSHLIGQEAEKKPGDVRASWFIAEAFKYETVYSNDFRPGAGILPIEKALEAATSPEMKFRVIAELTARLIALDRTDEARSLIMSIRDQYPDEEHQMQFDAWLAKGDEIKAYYTKVRTDEAEATDTFAADQYVLELKRRAAIAEKHGEKRIFDRYQKSITDIEKNRENKRAEKKVPQEK